MKKSDDQLEEFFSGHADALALFTDVHTFLKTLGPIQVEVMHTQISFAATRKFAWVWLPQTWIKKRPENSITLTFVLDRPIDHLRIEARIEPKSGRWTHHLILEQPADLDADVQGWLREAYILGSRIRRF